MSEKSLPGAQLQTAVLFLVFNRPETTKQVFEAIRQAKPRRLYVAADGPRLDREDEVFKVERVIDIVSRVDWPCELKTLFRKKNLGCKYAVSSAIDWFFENEEEGIILEDDCLPSKSFFFYCEKFLDKYRNESKVMVVSGTNINESIQVAGNHFFSRYALMWGWATWARAWKKYRVEMDSWPPRNQYGHLKLIGLNRLVDRLIWREVFVKTKANKIDTWDYQWIYCCWLNNGLTVLPYKNLVKNIGFTGDATHTTNCNHFLSNLTANEADFSVDFQVSIQENLESDEFVSRIWFGVSFLSLIKMILFRIPGVIKINKIRHQLFRR